MVVKTSQAVRQLIPESLFRINSSTMKMFKKQTPNQILPHPLRERDCNA